MPQAHENIPPEHIRISPLAQIRKLHKHNTKSIFFSQNIPLTKAITCQSHNVLFPVSFAKLSSVP